MNQIIGEFGKEVWAGRDESMSVGSVKFDATRAVLSQDLDFIHALTDCDGGSDEIGRQCVDWHGPCSVYVVDAVAEFFGVPPSCLQNITQSMLDEARNEYGHDKLDQESLELRLHVTYQLNGEAADALRANLERMVQHAIAEGLLTGETAAEVRSFNFNASFACNNTVIEGAAS